MVAGWIEQVTGSFEDKKRWKEYKARKQALPESYRTALDGLERYVMYAGAIAKGDVLVQMLEDLADFVEQAAADGTPIRRVVGDDPVDFTDDLHRELRRWAVGEQGTQASDRRDRSRRRRRIRHQRASHSHGLNPNAHTGGCDDHHQHREARNSRSRDHQIIRQR